MNITRLPRDLTLRPVGTLLGHTGTHSPNWRDRELKEYTFYLNSYERKESANKTPNSLERTVPT